ncbi:S-layer homology domain-containing protein [Lachnospiraceae bacterium MD329]|nr:S-layer homology domain-containing protein [Lachnospiraceae bacterium MD329]
MKQKLSTKILSLVLAFSIILSFCTVIPAGALDSSSDTSDTRGKLSMAYLGTGEMPEAEAQEIPTDTLEWNVGQKFWVGLYISDTKKMDTAIASTLTTFDRASLFEIGDGKDATGGLFSIAAGLIYSGEYLKPAEVDPDLYGTGNTATDFGEHMMAGIQMTPQWNNPTLGSRYAVDGVTAFGDAPLAHESAEDIAITADPKTLAWSVTSSNVTNRIWRNKGTLTNDPVYLMVAQFQVIKKPAAGVKAIAAARNAGQLTIQTGTDGSRWGGQWNKTRSTTPEENIKNFFDYTGDLDLFPAGASIQTGIKVKDSTTPTLTFIAEKAITDPIASIQKVFDSGDPEDVASADVKYYYSATDKGAASFAAADLATGFTQVTLTNGIPKVENNFLYASDGKFAIKLGALTVNDATVDTITSVTATPGTVYNGDNVVFADGKFQVKGKLTNGKDYTYTTAAQLASSGLAFYKDSNCTVTDLGTYTVSAGKDTTDTNTFYIAKTADKTKKKDFNVTVTYNKTVAQATGTPTLKYNEGDTLATDTFKVKLSTLKNTTGTDTNFNALPSNVTIVIADNDNNAKTATAITASTTVKASDFNKYLYIVVDNNGVKTVTKLSNTALSQKAGDNYALTGTLKATAATYPGKLNIDELKVKITDGDTGATKSEKSLADAGATVQIVDGTTVLANNVTKDTVITPAMSGKTLKVTVDGKELTVKVPTIAKKKVSLTATSGAAITKVYDKTNALPASANITYGVDGLETGDNAGTVTANAVYSNVNKGENIAITISAPASNSADFNSKYEFNTTMPTTVKGAITPATLKITNITKITTAQRNTSQSGPFKKTGETANQGQFTADATKKLYAGDQVTITYDVEFTEADIKAGANTEVNVTVSNVAITGGTSKDNYTLDSAVPTAKGKVTKRVLSSIKNPVVPTDLTYGDVYPTMIQVTATFEGGVADDTAEANITEPTGGWKVGDNTVTVTYEEGGVTKTTTATINVAPKKINLSYITFRATKQAGAAEVTANNTIADGVLVGDDVVTVKAATYTFDESKVNEEQDITVSGITLDGDNAGNYVIVDGDGNPITAETTAQGKGTINQGTTEAPTAINTSVNSSNGSITVTEPVTAGDKKVEYSFDGGLTWTDDATKSDITPGTEYTIQARYKAAEDGSTGASDVVTTTVKISQVRLFSVGDDSATAKPQQTFYTAGTEFVEKNITISRVTGTFTDKEGTTAVTFPLTLTSATTDLYVTVKRGGGGGGGSTSYTVKFSAGSHGKITEGKATTSVVLGAKLKATALPTITPDEGYRFIGWSADGETVVDPTTITVSKALSLTALYEEDKVEPTPTPTPLIKNNLKPYASGYDDGMFLPNDYITRAELASMIARLINGDDISNSYKASFADVDDTWYNKYIGYLEDKDVLSGYEDGTFRPNNSVTRGEMCAIIVRAQRYGLIPVDGMFTDVTDEDWAKTYITTLASMNIVSGYEDGTFGTYSPITRAETVAIINRVLEPSVPVITFTPLDIAGHWAEADIMLAVNERQLKNAVTEPTATPEATPEVTAEPTDAPETTPEATVEPTATPAA